MLGKRADAKLKTLFGLFPRGLVCGELGTERTTLICLAEKDRCTGEPGGLKTALSKFKGGVSTTGPLRMFEIGVLLRAIAELMDVIEGLLIDLGTGTGDGEITVVLIEGLLLCKVKRDPKELFALLPTISHAAGSCIRPEERGFTIEF